MQVLQCQNLGKSFGSGRTYQLVLDNVSLSFERGERCVIVGPSGSGKTTLLSILGCLLSPSTGTVQILDRPVDFRRSKELVQIRRSQIGFVFQSPRLLPFVNIEENLLLVARNLGVNCPEGRRRVTSLLDRLGLTSIRGRPPEEVSGGERQRVAIARSLLSRPPILLADEPTASLDWANGERVMQLLVQLATEHQSLLIIVTHDVRIMPFMQRVVRMDSGKVTEE
jgi:ABC-type lipoprotein export system ATPase subunit